MGSFRRDPLIEGLLRPKTMASLALAEWDRLLPRARLAELLRARAHENLARSMIESIGGH